MKAEYLKHRISSAGREQSVPAASPGAPAAPAGSLRRWGGDDIMPGRAPAALTQESPGETRRAGRAARGDVPLPSPAPTA